MSEQPAFVPTEANAPDISVALLLALQRLGFVVKRDETEVMVLLTADWKDDQDRIFYLTYTHYHPSWGPHSSYVNLNLLRPCHILSEPLVTNTYVRKVADVRQLLLNNCRYKQSRLEALRAGTLLPAAQQHTA